jgi:hypothetical protein
MSCQIKLSTEERLLIAAESSMKRFIAFPEENIRQIIKAPIKSCARKTALSLDICHQNLVIGFYLHEFQNTLINQFR